MANVKYIPLHDMNELKKHLNKPIKLSTVDGKLFDGILGHVDGQNIHIVVPINIGSNHVGNIGTDHVGDIYETRPYGTPYAGGYSARGNSTGYYYGNLTLPLASLAGLSTLY
ncbi:hypothetical protein EV207_101210 [Scopulibacillus darangshiensis]|uniref:Uncharacterized protein n=1 Tax=Scopulibacillus darangshiensis TaxID=442528 RepID=A0A4R2PB45_9BACL|nr:hypothetical protein [Scopulibacillus darangshiensis]TCP32232.1 hypothetical protein EV207_101210 [Scopulibacillus darangshiensis]